MVTTRYLVTQPSYIGDTLLYPGNTVDAGSDFVPSPHLVPQPAVVLASEDVYPTTPATPPPQPAPTVIVVKKKKK